MSKVVPSPESLLAEAVAITDPTDRERYLDQACAADDSLRAEIHRLLQAHFQAGAFLEHAPVLPDGATRTFGDSTHAPGPGNESGVANSLGTVIGGRYTLLAVIGEGGMGTVYRADQTTPVKRQVALKLIKAGMDSKGVLARFDAERQALALMDHPNIARIYDGGVTSGGQPFFVMELVNGVPLTEYCDSKRLTVDARLQLFVSVCQAVQHAHQKGIIHRDLKPSNVLVTEVDGRAMPKVIDFGVAKATELKLTEMSFADTGAIVGTPTYMSPEQADPSSMDIDTRTDVYALGVMLYELLTGSPPIDGRQFQRGAILEMLRMVREVEPPRPSTRLSTADALPNIAANRSIDPSKLAKLLQGELDWVVLKALEKDRTRRYDTANGLAADILRYLSDEVVEARPPSRGYRLTKFVKRNKGQVIAASLLLLTLVAGVVVSVYFAVLAGKEATAARKAEGEAEAEAKAALKAEADANEARATAERESKEAKWQSRLANDARHAIQIDQALRAREDKDYDRVAALLGDMRPEYQDAWETRYVRTLWRRETPLRAAFTGHSGWVRSVAFSPDGTRVVTASDDKTARVWDAGTGKVKAVLTGHTAGVLTVAFSPDGTRVVTAGADGTARVWDAATGQQKAALQHSRPFFQVAFSPDGTRVVTAGIDDTARVWDATTGQLKAALKGGAGFVFSAAFSAEGTRVLTAGNDDTPRIWDATTGQQKVTFKHKDPVRSVAFSPDGTRVVTGSGENTARIWDAETGLEKAVFKHTGRVAFVAFSPDGTRVVTASWDNAVRVWDAATGQERAALRGHTGPVNSVAFSQDGLRIVTGSWDRTARVWDAATGQENAVFRHSGGVESVAFSPDGTRVVTATNDSTARVWDSEPVLEKALLKHTGQVMSVAFSPDGTRIVTATSDGATRVWDAATGQEKATLKGHTGGVNSVAFSPDGTRIATASYDQTARVWDAATGLELIALTGHTGSVWSVAFSPDGTRIVTASHDRTARVWDVATGRVILTLQGHTSTLNSVAYSPDGNSIVTASYDRTARVWDAATGRETASLKHTGQVMSVAFSSDGTRIVTASNNKTARVWDAATGHEKAVFTGHTGPVYGVVFSPDGTRIATASDDKTVRVWDAVTGQEKAALMGHMDAVHCVAFSPDGTRVVSGSLDTTNTVRVWDAEPGREMLPAERHKPPLPVAPPPPDKK